jgi:hypothetical protein
LLDHGRLARGFLSQSIQHFPLFLLLIFGQRRAFASNITGQEKAHWISLPFRHVAQHCLIVVSDIKRRHSGFSIHSVEVLRKKNSQ